MSSYTQPVAYVDNTVLNSTTIQSNEESIRDYTNQEIVSGDFQAGKLQTEDIANYSYNAVLQQTSFVSGDVAGNNVLQSPVNRSFVTCTTKNNSPTTGVEWQDIANAGSYIEIDSNCDAIINVMLLYKIPANSDAVTLGNGGPGLGAWMDSLRLYKLDIENNTRTTYLATDSYCFGYTTGSSSPDTLSPGDWSEVAAWREIMVTVKTSLTKGVYYFGFASNPHNEAGYATIKNTTIETFYV